MVISIKGFSLTRCIISCLFVFFFQGCTISGEKLIFPNPNLGFADGADPMVLTALHKYYLEISLGSEFGDQTGKVRKWVSPMRIFVPDTSFSYMNEELNLIVEEINALSPQNWISIVKSRSEANMIAYFGNKDTYVQQYERNAESYVNSNLGLFWVYWNGRFELIRGSVFVDMVRLAEATCQRHLLREELTQSLGLFNDSFWYPNSIFYQNWTCSPNYAPFDKSVIQIHMDDKILPGMDRKATEALLLEKF